MRSGPETRGDDWFVYDKSTARVEDGELRFDIVESGLTKTEAVQDVALQDGLTMAHIGSKTEKVPEDMTRKELAHKHNGGAERCCNCGGAFSREDLASDEVVVNHGDCI